MVFLCNIVFGRKTETRFPPLSNIVDDYRDTVPGIPTFIIGWERTKKIFPGASILDPAVGENIFWIYGPRERRERYEEGVEWMRSVVLGNINRGAVYRFDDIICMPVDEKRRLYRFLTDGEGVVYLVWKDMLYYLDGNEIHGVSLRDIDYEGGCTERLLTDIEGNPVNRAIDPARIPDNVFDLIGNRVHLLPYIMSKQVD